MKPRESIPRRSLELRNLKFWKSLQNPWALIGQGFLIGAIVFFAAHPDSLQAAVAAI